MPRTITQPHIIVITGMSGAGKSTALKTLEDLGYEAVDNIPISILPVLIADSQTKERHLVIGVDVRSRDFNTDFFLHEVIPRLRQSDKDSRIVFLDSDDEVLRRRFKETRRKHPISEDRLLMDGIREERALITKIRDKADMVVDTSDYSIPDLKRWIKDNFSLQKNLVFPIHIVSFSYRHGLPRDADLVFDVRFLKNPHYETGLKSLNGQDKEVGEFIKQDPKFPAFKTQLDAMLETLLPYYIDEGKNYLTIAIGCTGGKHRSVYVAEELSRFLSGLNYKISLRHRELIKAK